MRADVVVIGASVAAVAGAGAAAVVAVAAVAACCGVRVCVVWQARPDLYRWVASTDLSKP